jgi:alkanesulfonate monooxygenase
MTRCEIGDEKTLAETFASSSLSVAEIRERGLVVGTPDEIVARLGAWAEAGVQRIMLQWLDLDDLDGLETLGTKVLPQVQG